MSQASKEIDAIIASKPDWRGQKLAELRAIILKSVPGITETVKWKMPSKPLGSPTWEVNGIVCVADYLKKAVRLTFPKGAQLSDPTGLFNARLDSKVARAIDFFETDNLEEEALEQILQDAAKRN
jgi:hypothetical protein